MTAKELLIILQEIVDSGQGDLRVAYVDQRDGRIRKALYAYPFYRSSGDDYFTLVGGH